MPVNKITNTHYTGLWADLGQKNKEFALTLNGIAPGINRTGLEATLSATTDTRLVIHFFDSVH